MPPFELPSLFGDNSTSREYQTVATLDHDFDDDEAPCEQRDAVQEEMTSAQSSAAKARLLLITAGCFLCFLCLDFAFFLITAGNKNGAMQASPNHSELSNVPNPSQFELCRRVNHVPRSTRSLTQFAEDVPFSLREEDFVRHHPNDCATSEELTKAIRDGQRVWPKGAEHLDVQAKQQTGSTFVPDQCHIPTMQPTEMCDILNQFSHIFLSGDSLSRHLLEGFLIGLSNNFVWDGMRPDDMDKTAKKECRCDGQFSETEECRQFKDNYHILRPQKDGICPHLVDDNNDSFVLRKTSVRNVPQLDVEAAIFNDIDCSDPDYKGMLIMFQGGLHYKMKQRAYNDYYWDPFMENPVIRQCAEHGKLFVIWQDQSWENPLVDARYPYQAPDNAQRFNYGVYKHFTQRLDNVGRAGWMNMTTMAQSSDGIHGLMNGTYAYTEIRRRGVYSFLLTHLVQSLSCFAVNYFKAQYITRLADLMVSEGKHATFRK